MNAMAIPISVEADGTVRTRGGAEGPALQGRRTESGNVYYENSTPTAIRPAQKTAEYTVRTGSGEPVRGQEWPPYKPKYCRAYLMLATLLSSSCFLRPSTSRPVVFGSGFFGGFFWMISIMCATCLPGISVNVAQYLSV